MILNKKYTFLKKIFSLILILGLLNECKRVPFKFDHTSAQEDSPNTKDRSKKNIE